MTLTLQAVDKTYPGRHGHTVRAVQALDLDVAHGEIVALLGSSGCGKTSTLRMIAGFEEVSRGAITLAGKRIDMVPPAKRGVAMAFEGYALYPPLDVEGNIGFGLAREGKAAGGRDVKQRVGEVAELLEITPILKRRPAGLSGGQQQRASLARALARDASLHLLDEPMGQLEPQLRAVLRGRVKSLIKHRGYTAILVTHDQTEANAMADRIAVMEGGILQQYGSPETLRDRPANLFVATFLGEPPMNALRGRATGGAILIEELGGLRLSAPIEAPDGEIVLGIRPNRLRLGDGAQTGRVVSNRWLGDQAHVAIERGGRVIVCVSHTRIAARVGSQIAFAIDPADVHLFDPATGRAISHGYQRA